MKQVLISLTISILLCSCGNDLTVKKLNSPVKLSVTDYNKVYKRGDTVLIREHGGDNYEIEDNENLLTTRAIVQ